MGALIKKSTAGKGTSPDAKTEEKAASSATRRRPKNRGDEVQHVPLSRVVPSPLQPRTHIPEAALAELHESIRQHGVIQPLIVRAVGDKLELIAGERRLRACEMLKLETVPVIEREASDREVLEMALVENLQRQDLSAIEEANGYVRLSREFGMKQDEIAQRVGKSRAAIANSMRLLDLHKDIQNLLNEGEITVGHAKAILGLKDKREQLEVATEVRNANLNVRATERLVQKRHAGETPKRAARPEKAVDPATAAMINALTARLREHFTTRVSITHSGHRGRIELEYYNNDDLERLLELMRVSMEGL